MIAVMLEKSDYSDRKLFSKYPVSSPQPFNISPMKIILSIEKNINSQFRAS